MNGKRVTKAQLGHLRRLLGWLRCQIGPDAYELICTMKSIAPVVGELSPDAKDRLVAAGDKAMRTPRYVRNAIKQLEKVVADLEAEDGEVVEGEAFEAAMVAQIQTLSGRAA